MPLVFEGNVIRFDGHCTVEEALTLAQALVDIKDVEIVLSSCESMHTALLQTLIAGQPKITGVPQSKDLASLIRTLVRSEG
ncbi:hypothetical protein [Asticcacaulis benevestitus]|uniref:STAS domain-containing protein n=1 Tax=Asticcacaulis benevestitus DSM 16100 = ATCC BAA-896 TaxID=1121022 RepID=V4PYZ0_9CAUL|nr:hypothetical protein [Asticcacaulis benevestitus]ESQ92629.1 hypothetical protein ABENE_07365 [Asticcacaulis benevestitus DSM 16100 = ATCC BAA-896]